MDPWLKDGARDDAAPISDALIGDAPVNDIWIANAPPDPHAMPASEVNARVNEASGMLTNAMANGVTEEMANMMAALARQMPSDSGGAAFPQPREDQQDQDDYLLNRLQQQTKVNEVVDAENRDKEIEQDDVSEEAPGNSYQCFSHV